MGRTGGSSFKTISRKYFMAQVPVETVCVLSKTEPVHLAICLPHTSMK